MTGGDYLWDRSGPPDADVQKLEGVLSALRHRGAAPELVIGSHAELRVESRPVVPASRTPIRGRVLSMAAMVMLAILAGLLARPAVAPSLKVDSQRGSPLIGSRGAGDRLHIGQWLETDARSSARIEVASLGHVTVNPNSRIRLRNTGKSEHRLEMPYGRIHAFITAPPRVFLVDTPAAVAVDMGCEYTLDVREDGSGILRVSLGYVHLEGHGRTSEVPMFGGTCRTRTGYGPGTPYFDDASSQFISALELFDFGGGSEDQLKVVLDEAREKDALSLWHLIPRTSGPARDQVVARLAELKPMPPAVNRRDILDLRPEALRAWNDHMRPY